MAATLLCDRVRQEIDSGKMIGAVYLDLTKAFDTIGHSILINKLPAFGIQGKELVWLTDYLFNRYQSVEIKGCSSCKEPIMTGVPQRSILGPLLFIMFFNDFTNHVHHSEVIMYADDTVLLYANKDPRQIEKNLNEGMNNIEKYCFNNELIVNTKKGKTEVMLFGSAKRLHSSGKELEIKFANKRINFVTSYNYLGIIVDNTLTLNDHFNRSYKKASSRLRLLERMKIFTTAKARHIIYLTMILPLLTYSCPVHSLFTNTQQTKLLSLERRTASILPEFQLPSIHKKVKKECVLMVKKCLNKEFGCETFNSYFTLINHGKSTRNNRYCIKLPGFYFTGGNLYNDLPLVIRKLDDINTFRTAICTYFN